MTAVQLPPRREAPPLQVSRTLRISTASVLGAALATAVVEAARAVGSDAGRPDIVDFHPFYLAGRLVLDGHFADAYRIPIMGELERAFGGGRDVLTPFVYPPLFGFVMAPFAALPVWAAFLIFVGASLALYLAVLRRLAGAWFWPTVLTMSPVLLVDIRMGQNGFLTAGLAGLATALALGGRGGLAGAALGLLAFKPQMATMLPVWLLLERHWRALAVAATVGLGLTIAGFAAAGPGTLSAFLAGTAALADLMTPGAFPLHRMTSIYGCALSLGVPARLALMLHGGVTVVVLALTISVMARLDPGRDGAGGDRRAAAGMALMATAFVSPYFFDYDLTIFGAGLALVLPRLADAMSRRRLVGLLIAIGCIEAWGLAVTVLIGFFPEAGLSLGGPALLACYSCMLLALDRRRSMTGAAWSNRQKTR